MARKFTVSQTTTGEWAAFNVRGELVAGPFAEEWRAHLNGAHWSRMPSLFKRLKLRTRDGITTGRPFAGVSVDSLYRQPSGEWRAVCTVDDRRVVYVGNTRETVLKLIAAHGRDIKMTRNILNPDAGEIEIERAAWGGCCDPGTERYHCM